MDLRTRWTLIGGAAAAALVAVATLPPRTCEPGQLSLAASIMCGGRGPGRLHHRHDVEARRAHGRLALALQQRLLADTLLVRSRGPRALRSASGITVIFDAPVTTDSARSMLERADREVAMLPPGGAGGQVILYLAADPFGALSQRLKTDWVSDLNYRVPSRFAMREPDGRTHCFTVLTLGGRGAGASRRGGALDWCALYARYGVPGDGVAEWAAGTFRWQWRWGVSFAEQAAAEGGGAFRRTDETFMWRACANGSTAQCQALIGNGGNPSSWMDSEQRRAFLAWLVRKEGGERFGRFWRAGGSIGDAIATGFGRSERDVVRDWVVATVGEDPGPSARPRVILAGALWASLALSAAFVAMYRRQTR
jgi:hypothetical protein